MFSKCQHYRPDPQASSTLKLHPLFSMDSLDIVQYPKNVNPDDILFKTLASLIPLTIVNPLKIN
jgi:hypothetical protein